MLSLDAFELKSVDTLTTPELVIFTYDEWVKYQKRYVTQHNLYPSFSRESKAVFATDLLENIVGVIVYNQYDGLDDTVWIGFGAVREYYKRNGIYTYMYNFLVEKLKVEMPHIKYIESGVDRRNEAIVKAIEKRGGVIVNTVYRSEVNPDG